MITCGRCQTVSADGTSVCPSCGNRLSPAGFGVTTPLPGPKQGGEDTMLQPPVGAPHTYGAPAAPPTYGAPTYGAPPLVPGEPKKGKGLLVTAIVLAVVLVVAVTVLITLLVTKRSNDVATGTTTAPTAPASTTAPTTPDTSPRPSLTRRPTSTTTAPLPPPKATLAPLPTVKAGDDAMLAFAFTGEPADVLQTLAVVNDTTGDAKEGYVNPLPLRAQGPGTVQVAVRLLLLDGTEVTTNSQTLTIELPPPAPTPAPTPPPTVMPPYVPPKPSKGAVGTVNEDDVIVRAGPTTSSAAVGKVDKGTQVDVICLIAGETIGNEVLWANLSDGNYIFLKFVTIQADPPRC